MTDKNIVYYQIIDANINRVSEGLRVIEDYTRFIGQQKEATDQLSKIRKVVNESEADHLHHLIIRDTTRDMRAAEKPRPRKDTFSLLKANFKRVEEGLRVLEEYTGNQLYNQIRYQMYTLEKDILLTVAKPLLTSGVYLISDEIEVLKQGLAWRVSAIQLRDKISNKKDILKKALMLQPLAKKAGIPFIVNDYLDIAIASNADGIHTGQDDLAVEEIRRIIGPHKLIGRSTHTIAQGKKAEATGADYVGLGPIWGTPTKPERKPIGVEYLQQARTKLTIPYVAIGGINKETMETIAPYKPPLIAVVRAYKEIPFIQKEYFAVQED
ncbi:MAG: thiamine phosphate synthase [Patescibacteria group bacterium]